MLKILSGNLLWYKINKVRRLKLITDKILTPLAKILLLDIHVHVRMRLQSKLQCIPFLLNSNYRPNILTSNHVIMNSLGLIRWALVSFMYVRQLFMIIHLRNLNSKQILQQELQVDLMRHRLSNLRSSQHVLTRAKET